MLFFFLTRSEAFSQNAPDRINVARQVPVDPRVAELFLFDKEFTVRSSLFRNSSLSEKFLARAARHPDHLVRDQLVF